MIWRCGNTENNIESVKVENSSPDIFRFEWFEFWERFESTVHSKQNLSKARV